MSAKLTSWEKFWAKYYLAWDKFRGRLITPFAIRRILKLKEGVLERKRLCVYAHYDPIGRVHPYVLKQLQAYKKLGCTLTFVTACKSLNKEDETKLCQLADNVLFKRDFGRDFASYFIGLTKTPNAFEYEQIVLTNDSVYGPFRDLSSVFNQMAERNLDMWGITDSRDPIYHLQSYFWVFNKRVIESGFVREFWGKWPNYFDKEHIIHQGELVLTRRAVSSGFRVGALCEYDAILPKAIADWKKRVSIGIGLEKADENENKPWRQIYSINHFDGAGLLRKFLVSNCNSTQFFWDILLEEGCPFLKADLLKTNPLKIWNINFAKDMLPADEWKLINSHIQIVHQKTISF